MASKGGKRQGAGRKTKAEEKKANFIMLQALKRIYSEDVDNEAKIKFVMDLANNTRGQLFIAEHIFGKPEQKTDITTAGEKIQNIISLGLGKKPNE